MRSDDPAKGAGRSLAESSSAVSEVSGISADSVGTSGATAAPGPAAGAGAGAAGAASDGCGSGEGEDAEGEGAEGEGAAWPCSGAGAHAMRQHAASGVQRANRAATARFRCARTAASLLQLPTVREHAAKRCFATQYEYGRPVMSAVITALTRLREGNTRYASNVSSLESMISHTRRGALAEGQQPTAIVLGCSDSRCPLKWYSIKASATCS